MISRKDIYVYIFSWNKVTANATNLYHAVSTEFPTTWFINCDETITMPPEIRTIQRDDSFYYGGQFATALGHAPVGAPIAVIVGDVSPEAPWGQIADHAVAAINSGRIGIYAPNVDYTWHVKRNTPISDISGAGDLWTVPNTDCTCWFLVPSVLDTLRALPIHALSNLGWGIDTIAITECGRQKLRTARDYSTLVRQPNGTAYNQQKAREQQARIMGAYATWLRALPLPSP
jgi:hypothetical protein